MIHPELLDRFTFIVLDEVHHAGSEVFSNIIHRLSDGHRVMALTATLKREDERHMIIMSKLPVVYCLDLATAIKQGLVAPVEVIPVGVDMSDGERREYSEIERKINDIKSALRIVDDAGERARLERLERFIRWEYRKKYGWMPSEEELKRVMSELYVSEMVRRNMERAGATTGGMGEGEVRVDG